ncbi:hypothetical protein ACFLZL_01475 [Thermodesulfobacteriota bacterium]
MKKIYVVITMDCERPRTETRESATGPQNWDESHEFIIAYVKHAQGYDYPVSFFLHPEVAIAHSDLLLKLEKEGCFIDGLHIHPWKFGDGKYKAHFGGMDRTEQIAIISEASAIYQSGLKRRPKYFRPGTFSANDYTISVLEDLGFRGGSLSVPGRVYLDINAVWTGCPVDPHRTNRIFRMVEGDMNFANMPLTCDLSNLEEINGRFFYRDLRPDYQDANYHKIASNIVDQLLQRNPAVPVINMVTHNDNNYTDPENRVCKNFVTVLNEITNACRKAGVKPVGTTFDKICDLVLEMPYKAKDFAFV